VSARTVQTLLARDPIALYEADASAFRRFTGLMAPGKSIAPEMDRDDFDYRMATWRAYMALLGPSDLAATVAVELWREQERNRE